MKRRFLCSLLVFTLLMGMVGTSFAASLAPPPTLPFGEEVIPLSQEEMEDVEGGWVGTAARVVVGAAFAGATYYARTDPAERNWSDGLWACAIGAMGTFIGRF